MPTKAADTFERVKNVGLALPNVEATTKYDGSPVLKVRGCFMAGLATHPSAEPQTLVVRVDLEEREWLLQDAPETYYVTDYYERYPLVLVRLSRIDRDALRDLLSVSWRLGVAKAGHYPQKPGRRGNKTHRDLSAETRKRGKQTRLGSIRGADEGAELLRRRNGPSARALSGASRASKRRDASR